MSPPGCPSTGVAGDSPVADVQGGAVPALSGATHYRSAADSFSDGESSDVDGGGSVRKSGGHSRLDFAASSAKSSVCSDASDESSTSGSVNKPHRGNDGRWEAIQTIRSKDGVLGLKHFRLLKKLGSGDIGSVHLAELTTGRCYFAMKVMNKEALGARKKLVRAQTEREILKSLDHPFLPTLYTHFESEKFSCLVMEFCPGGDLHVLRQRQPGKYFPEHASR